MLSLEHRISLGLIIAGSLLPVVNDRLWQLPMKTGTFTGDRAESVNLEISPCKMKVIFLL